MAQIIVGIDPGLKGAIVAINGATVVDFTDMHTKPRVNGKGLEIDQNQLLGYVDYLQTVHTVKSVFMEKVHAMHQQGATSAFHFGKAVGVIETAFAPLQPIFISPKSWKNKSLLAGKRKRASRLRAMRLFPDHKMMFERIGDTDRADAALIAYYGNMIT